MACAFDEFAEVLSIFAFKNKIKIDSERLLDAATEYHHLEKGNPKELRRDAVTTRNTLLLGQCFIPPQACTLCTQSACQRESDSESIPSPSGRGDRVAASEVKKS